MARPFWRGQLRLALVTCPINLTPATTERDKIRFHKLNRETGNRLRMQMIPRIPVLVLTGQAGANIEAAVLREGGDDVMVKPCEPRQLCERAEVLLAMAPPRRERPAS